MHFIWTNVIFSLILGSIQNVFVIGKQNKDSISHSDAQTRLISLSNSLIWGPGLRADVALPARYFFIQPVDTDGNKYDILILTYLVVEHDCITASSFVMWIQISFICIHLDFRKLESY